MKTHDYSTCARFEYLWNRKIKDEMNFIRKHVIVLNREKYSSLCVRRPRDFRFNLDGRDFGNACEKCFKHLKKKKRNETWPGTTTREVLN